MVSHPVANGVEPCSCRARYLNLQQCLNDADEALVLLRVEYYDCQFSPITIVAEAIRRPLGRTVRHVQAAPADVVVPVGGDD
eukprot:CAMPEP_0117509596 /NCGR_PEP_ID=MMETSP0784-20121206/27557_1 /TAXON_ID=39447 /ORGANISM="" /LENGTH=81 /DNA_ID=CAMNT_0005305209 /DNA_START=650 /DNA_END=895 /DNA_ORIENTATION=-